MRARSRVVFRVDQPPTLCVLTPSVALTLGRMGFKVESRSLSYPLSAYSFAFWDIIIEV